MVILSENTQTMKKCHVRTSGNHKLVNWQLICTCGTKKTDESPPSPTEKHSIEYNTTVRQSHFQLTQIGFCVDLH